MASEGAIRVIIDSYTKLESDTLFVAKVEGKGLSTNEYLNKVNSLEQTLFSMTGGVTISNTANEISLLDGEWELRR